MPEPREQHHDEEEEEEEVFQGKQNRNHNKN
jgi:hypothetical protein